VKSFARWCIWIGSAVSGITGVVYWWMLNMMEPVSEFAVINHPLQPWVLKAHIVTAPLLVFAIGIIATDHIWKQYRLGVRAGRRSGVSAMWMFLPMVLSGYLIQAVTTPSWLTALAWIHLGTGLVFVVGLVIHQIVVPNRRARKRAREMDLEVVRSKPDPRPTPRPRARPREETPFGS
jgi:hypothetical protein